VKIGLTGFLSARNDIPAVLAVLTVLVLACSRDNKDSSDTSDAGDTGTDTDSNSDTGTDTDTDSDTDTVPWSKPEVAGVLLSVWGSGPDDVYAGGEGQTLLHGAGSTWELLPLPGGFNASDIRGSAWDSVFVLDAWGGPLPGWILRYDGAQWSEVARSSDIKTIWVCGIDDAFGIWSWVNPMEPAYYGTAVVNFDGAGWTSVWSDGFMSSDAGQLHYDDMTGTADGYVFSVGVIHVGEPSAVVSNGVGWWTEAVPETDLHGVWALDAENVWAVGDGGAILRRGDAAWELQDVPIDGAQLHGVWGAAPDDVYAVGEGDGGALIIHCDGAAWSVVYGE
jgi:hypothetical protein